MISNNFINDTNTSIAIYNLANHQKIIEIPYYQRLITAILIVVTIYIAIKLIKKQLRENKIRKMVKGVKIIENKK